MTSQKFLMISRTLKTFQKFEKQNKIATSKRILKNFKTTKQRLTPDLKKKSLSEMHILRRIYSFSYLKL